MTKTLAEQVLDEVEAIFKHRKKYLVPKHDLPVAVIRRLFAIRTAALHEWHKETPQ